MWSGLEAIKLILFQSSICTLSLLEVCTPSPSTSTCQLLSVFSTYRGSRQNSRRASSHQVERGESAAGQASSCLHTSSLPAGRPGPSLPMLPLHPATLPLTQCLHGLCPSYLSPLISICFFGLWPFCWPKLQVLSALLSLSPFCPATSTGHRQHKQKKRERERILFGQLSG